MADNHKAKAESMLGRAGYAEGGSLSPQDLKDAYDKSNAASSKMTRAQLFEQANKRNAPNTNYPVLDILGQKKGGRVRARKAK